MGSYQLSCSVCPKKPKGGDRWEPGQTPDCKDGNKLCKGYFMDKGKKQSFGVS